MKNTQAIERLEKMYWEKVQLAAKGDNEAEKDAQALDLAILIIRERPKLLVKAWKSENIEDARKKDSESK
jgi:hypothetical protein